MNCSQDLIEAYMDEELEPGLSASVGEHLLNCETCSEAYSRFRAQKANIRSAAPYYTAPEQLERSIRDALRQATANEAKPAPTSVPWRWLAVAATILLAISVSWNMRPSPRRTVENDLVAENILSGHIQAAAPPPEEIPPALTQMCINWGYLSKTKARSVQKWS